MSLVNNMLRDLDQRRKESESSGGGIKLMPASDLVGDENNGLVQLVLIGLALLTAALTYYWYTLNESNNEQQLGIQVGTQSVSAPAVEPEQLIQDLEASTLSSGENLAPARDNVEVIVSAPVELVAPNADSQQRDISAATAVTSTTTVATSTVSDVSQVQSTLTGVEQAPTPAQIDSAPVTQQAERVAAGAELVRSGPVESVKEAPRFSNEQLDTIAVQDALRLISSGETDAAYATLEQFIIGNRFAHQSRETYAKLLMSDGRVEDANALIDGGLELAANHSGFKKVKARLLMADGKLAEAVSILISRAPSVAQDPEYHDLLASAQLSSRDFSGAIISYRGLVQSDETQGKWWYGFASAHDQLGNVQPARQAYSQAMRYSNLSANLRRRSQERLSALAP